MVGCLASDASISFSDLTPKSLLMTNPRGAYTACRTFGSIRAGKILMLNHHLNRIQASLSILFPALSENFAVEECSEQQENQELFDLNIGPQDLCIAYSQGTNQPDCPIFMLSLELRPDHSDTIHHNVSECCISMAVEIASFICFATG